MGDTKKEHSAFRAVLFDMDGVIVDSLHYHYLAWRKMFDERGGSVSKHSVLLHEGRNSREILPLLMEEAGIHIPEEEREAFIDRKRKYYRSIVTVSHYEGAFDVVYEMRRRGFRTALVTASALRNMETAIPDRHRTAFEAIVTGDEVPRAKPFPDPYLIAARKLGIGPEECVVIENAPLGIESARNAGMYCIAVETTLGEEFLQEADVIVQSIRDVLSMEILRRPAP